MNNNRISIIFLSLAAIFNIVLGLILWNRVGIWMIVCGVWMFLYLAMLGNSLLYQKLLQESLKLNKEQSELLKEAIKTEKK